MAELSDDELLAELGISLEGKKVSACTPREERIIAGFGVSRGFARSMKGASFG